MCFERSFRPEERAERRRGLVRDLFSREEEKAPEGPTPVADLDVEEPEPEPTREKVPAGAGSS